MAAMILGLGVVLGFVLAGSPPAASDEALQVATPDVPVPVDPPDLPREQPVGDDPWDKVEQQAKSGEWLKVWKTIPAIMLHRASDTGFVLLALLTGLCWLVFLLQAGQIQQWLSVRLAAPLLAIPLGIASVWLTLFLVIWQEHYWGLERNYELIPGLRFFILGVGFREEFSKLICFLPLLAWTVWRRDELAAFVAAACVGVGFAMEENVGYIDSSAGTATLGRLLMAAPLHLSLTGLAGLAAYRACRWPKEWGSYALGVFGAVAIIHGLYDAFIVLPDLSDYSIVASIIFILVVRQFFVELKNLRVRGRDFCSLSANFAFCTSLVVAATFVVLSSHFGTQVAAKLLFPALLSQAIMAYLFFREMPESLVTV